MKTYQMFAIAAGALLLTACAHMSEKKGGPKSQGQAAEAQGAYSMGVGDQARFAGQDAQPIQEQTYYFDFDNSHIHDQDRASIQSQVNYLKSHPDARVLLAGHADERGSREYNNALGERRAKDVADVMMLEGVQPEQIRILSFGEEKPAVLGHDESSYALNRRVQLSYEAIG